MTTDAVGGVWTYATTLADGLRGQGVEVVLAVPGPEPSSAEREDRELRVCPGRLEWQEDPWDDVDRAGQWLLAQAEEVGADVVHLNDYSHGALDWQVPALVVGHSCVLSWWEGVHGVRAPHEWEHYRGKVSAGLHGADGVVAPSDAMLADLRRIYVFESPAEVIPNGVRDRFHAEVPKEPFVLGAGRLWDAAKALDALDDAAGALDWPVVVAGDVGSHSRHHAQSLGQLDRAELDRMMRRAAIFAHPARYEPFGLAPLEAGLARCALVLGDLPSLREVWGDAAVYVAPGDASALAEEIDRLIADPARREEMGWRARLRAGRYDAGRMARRYASLYRRLRARQAVAA
jgi:glycogen synthase